MQLSWLSYRALTVKTESPLPCFRQAPSVLLSSLMRVNAPTTLSRLLLCLVLGRPLRNMLSFPDFFSPEPNRYNTSPFSSLFRGACHAQDKDKYTLTSDYKLIQHSALIQFTGYSYHNKAPTCEFRLDFASLTTWTDTNHKHTSSKLTF